MTIEQLQYLTAVLKFHSLSKAARNLHITQSGLSKSINHLEQEVGFQIIDRGNGRIVLTKKGSTWLPSVKNFLNAYQQTRTMAHQIAISDLNIIKCAFVSPFKSLYDQIAAIHHQDSRTLIESSEQFTSRIVEGVKDGHYDLGFIQSRPVDQLDLSNLEVLDKTDAHLKLYVPKNNSLAHKEQITKQDISRQYFASMKNDPFTEQVMRELQSKVGPISIVFYATDYATVAYVAKGLNAVFVTTDQLFDLSDSPWRKYFTSFSLSSLMEDRVKLAWVYRKNYQLSPAARQLINTPLAYK